MFINNLCFRQICNLYARAGAGGSKSIMRTMIFFKEKKIKKDKKRRKEKNYKHLHFVNLVQTGLIYIIYIYILYIYYIDFKNKPSFD